MLNFETFMRLTRINEYLIVLLLSFPLIFYISPQNLFSDVTIIIFLANLFLTAFGYSFNDIEDAEDDYYDLKKGKRNPIANKELTRKQGYLISFFFLFFGLFLLYQINLLVFYLGLMNALLGFLYSWRHIRLKSIPILDLLSHVVFLGGIQFVIIYLSFRPLDLHIIPFLMIVIPVSMMNEIFHELIDFELDEKTKITNTTQKLSRFNIKKILMFLSIIVITGFSINILTFPHGNKIITLLFAFLIGVIPSYRVHARISKL
jgi:4-hydroxybenzoate polyprenyltransferase